MDVKAYELAKELTYKNARVVRYSIKYPQLFGGYNGVTRRLNQSYYNAAQSIAKYCETDFYREAKKYYDDAERLAYPFHEYTLMVTFEVTRKDEAVLSIYFDEGRYTGGANGMTTRTADNRRLNTGQQITLNQLYPGQKNYAKTITAEIEKQVAASPENYFTNYAELIQQSFTPENFYLKPEALTIFFQPITIAPHAAGVTAFDLPYCTGPINIS